MIPFINSQYKKVENMKKEIKFIAVKSGKKHAINQKGSHLLPLRHIDLSNLIALRPSNIIMTMLSNCI